MFFAGALFTAIGFLACAKPVVTLLLTPKYAMTGWILQALGVRVAFDIFAAPASTVSSRMANRSILRPPV